MHEYITLHEIPKNTDQTDFLLLYLDMEQTGFYDDPTGSDPYLVRVFLNTE